jgi:hypothetical protein
LDCTALPECHENNTFDRNELKKKETTRKNERSLNQSKVLEIKRGLFLCASRVISFVGF